jgi:hypothetical protein
MAVILWLLSPIGRYVAVGAIIAAAFGGWTIKERLAQYHADQAKFQQEAADAVAKANAARAAADKKFKSHPIQRGPKPHSWSLRHDPDGFARD